MIVPKMRKRTMASITYAVKIMDESGKEDYVPLLARNDRKAVLAMRRYMAEHHRQGENLFLSWHRSSDGCHGYINPDGNANPTGTAWR